MPSPTKTPARTRGRILVVDDEASIRELLTTALARQGHEVTALAGGAEALRRLSGPDADFDLVITDLAMTGVDGLEVLRHARSLADPPAVLMITAFATTDTAVEAMKLGAHDYLLKPFKLDELSLVVERALTQRALTRENTRLREEIRGVQQLDAMVARAPEMTRIFDLVRRAGPTRANVLIRGESGVGKELVARALHSVSQRPDGPFLAVNCGALPEPLMESELFGHVKGAFTGATADHKGMAVAASGGTLFLDEVGELGPSMQVKLLRALQERRVRPVGSTHEVALDCRFVAATNRDLEAAVEAGEFRKDLYFRLNVVQILVPPLRHRRDDLPLLIDRFFHRFMREMDRTLEGIEPRALQRLLDYSYPGNVRELENIIERAVALESGTTLSPEHIPLTDQPPPPTAGGGPAPIPPEGIDLERVLADFERDLLVRALAQTGGVRKRAAELLRVSFRSLRYRLQKLGIEVGGDDDGGGGGAG